VEKPPSIFIDTVGKALKQGDKVTLTGFGTFQCVQRAARTGRNPKTGKEIKIGAHSVRKFSRATDFGRH
jgi:DNA-binding protein HU-beta